MQSDERDDTHEGESTGLTPELEIAWARVVSHAADDPAFAQRLQDNPRAVLVELGVEVPDDVDPATDLRPVLADALAAIERQRAMLSGSMPYASSPRYVAAPGAPYASSPRPFVSAPYASSPQPWFSAPYASRPQPWYASTPPACYGTMGCHPWVPTNPYGTCGFASPWGSSAPQWLGGPPSGGSYPLW